MRLLILLVLIAGQAAGQWYEYAPLPVPQPSLSPQVGKGVSGRGPYLEARLQCMTIAAPGSQVLGDCAGEFWAWLDLDIQTVHAELLVPLLYDPWYVFDSQLLETRPPRFLPETLAAGPTYFLWLQTGFLLPRAPQAEGQAFALDLWWGWATIPLGRIYYSPALIGLSLVFQLSVVGNMVHETDGSGWCYLSTVRQITL